MSATPPEPGLLLRLTAPMQSWGEHSHFNERDTAGFPTRSGVLGMIASALGRSRQTPTDDLAALSLTVRIDRPGLLLRDLHTVGGGLPAKHTVTTAEGKKRPGDTGTLLTHRYYLTDAAFTAAVTAPPHHPDHDALTGLLDQCAHALKAPRWPLYLGRRSCPPEGPLFLGRTPDALHHLVHLPLATRTPRGTPHPSNSSPTSPWTASRSQQTSPRTPAPTAPTPPAKPRTTPCPSPPATAPTAPATCTGAPYTCPTPPTPGSAPPPSPA